MPVLDVNKNWCLNIMELVEPIEDLNSRLVDHFGISSDNGDPIWRLVWSDDQVEKRLGTYDDITPNGLYIRTVTEVREVPKYKQYIQQKFILERLVVIPDMNLPELPALKLSYEPIWTFEDKDGNYLPPRWDAIKFIIDTIYAAQYGTHNLKKYVDDESSQEAAIEKKTKEVDSIMEHLWGEQSAFSDGIKSKEIVMLGGKEFVKES